MYWWYVLDQFLYIPVGIHLTRWKAGNDSPSYFRQYSHQHGSFGLSRSSIHRIVLSVKSQCHFFCWWSVVPKHSSCHLRYERPSGHFLFHTCIPVDPLSLPWAFCNTDVFLLRIHSQLEMLCPNATHFSESCKYTREGINEMDSWSNKGGIFIMHMQRDANILW